MQATTTLKLPRKLKTRIAAIAKQTKRSPHRLMIEAIERHLEHEEEMRAFVEEALAANGEIDRGGEVYRAADVHTWIEGLAKGKKIAKPRPWRR